MKFAALLSAGLLAATAIVPVAASAQNHRERVVVKHHTVHRAAVHHRTRQVCKVTYRNHHRQRVCRTVHY